MAPQEKKDFVVNFYQECIARGDLTRIDEYMRDDYIQHGPHAEDGKEGFKQFARKFSEDFPNAKIEFKRVLCEGDFIYCHSHSVFYEGHLGVSVMDLFRLQDGMLAEHWEAFLDVPEHMKSGQSMF